MATASNPAETPRGARNNFAKNVNSIFIAFEVIGEDQEQFCAAFSTDCRTGREGTVADD